jgi:hypothetical protein
VQQSRNNQYHVAQNTKVTHPRILRRKYYDLIELGDVGNKVIQAWAFSCPPAVLALYVMMRTRFSFKQVAHLRPMLK